MYYLKVQQGNINSNFFYCQLQIIVHESVQASPEITIATVVASATSSTVLFSLASGAKSTSAIKIVNWKENDRELKIFRMRRNLPNGYGRRLTIKRSSVRILLGIDVGLFKMLQFISILYLLSL